MGMPLVRATANPRGGWPRWAAQRRPTAGHEALSADTRL